MAKCRFYHWNIMKGLHQNHKSLRLRSQNSQLIGRNSSKRKRYFGVACEFELAKWPKWPFRSWGSEKIFIFMPKEKNTSWSPTVYGLLMPNCWRHFQSAKKRALKINRYSILVLKLHFEQHKSPHSYAWTFGFISVCNVVLLNMCAYDNTITAQHFIRTKSLFSYLS